MSEKEFQSSGDFAYKTAASSQGQSGAACDTIDDPVRRSLCKVCGVPLVGEAPFCKDHEPPVP
jgi:hypothetical protein